MSITEERTGAGWDYEPPSAGGDYLKLQDGERAIVRFIGEPDFFRKDFGENSQYGRYKDVGKIRLFNYDAGEEQIWEAHPMHFKVLKQEREICAKDRDLEFSKCVFIMSRTGTKVQTRYSFSFLREDGEAASAPKSAASLREEDDQDIPF